MLKNMNVKSYPYVVAQKEMNMMKISAEDVMSLVGLNVMNVRRTMFNIKWWDNGQPSWSNSFLKQLNIYIGRLEFGWHQPFEPYMYLHDEWSLMCCGGMGTDCIHEEIYAEMFAEESNVR